MSPKSRRARKSRSCSRRCACNPCKVARDITTLSLAIREYSRRAGV